MNTLSQRIGAVAANAVDGTLNVASDAVYHTGVAASSFAQGYSEQHAKNKAARAAKLAMRGMRVEHITLLGVAA